MIQPDGIGVLANLISVRTDRCVTTTQNCGASIWMQPWGRPISGTAPYARRVQGLNGIRDKHERIAPTAQGVPTIFYMADGWWWPMECQTYATKGQTRTEAQSVPVKRIQGS